MRDFEEVRLDTIIPISEFFGEEKKATEKRKMNLNKEVLLEVYQQGKWSK